MNHRTPIIGLMLTQFGLALLGLLTFCTPVFALSDADQTTYRAAIELARAGQHDTAIKQLRDLHARNPTDVGLQTDLAVVLSWAGQHAEALRSRPTIGASEMPDYALTTLAQSARTGEEFAVAKSFFQILSQRHPQDLDPILGMALVSIDEGEFLAANKILQRLNAARSSDPAVLSVLAYYYRKRQQPVDALRIYQRILDINPQHREALRERILLASVLGAPDRALELLRLQPELLSPTERNRIEADAAARRIRWGTIEPPSEAERFVETDEAIDRLDALESLEQSLSHSDSPYSQRLLIDRMVALRDRERPLEVIVIYEHFVSAGVSLPSYGLLAAASAYLTAEKPEEAATVYRDILRNDPGHYDARRGLFYATLETEQFGGAYQIIDELVASEAPWHISADKKIRAPNERRLRAESDAILARAFGDDLAYAQSNYAALVAAVPLNTELWVNRASIYRWRGWPRKSRAEQQAALDLEPGLFTAQMGRAHANLDQFAFAHTASDVADLGARFPENKHIQRLQRRWDLHNRRELISRFTVGESSGGTERGSDYVDVETHLYSQPIASNYRAFVHHLYSTARFPEGDGLKHRIGAGIEYRRADPQVLATFEVLDGTSDHRETGAGGAIDWFIDDYWRVGGGLEISSPEVPLRGLRQGVTGDRVFVRGAYRWHESQEVRASYSYLDFDDGNRRHSAFAAFERRLLNYPKYKLTGVIEAFASNNSAKNRIYYNPEQDVSIGGTLIGTWRVYRRYEREFVHRLLLGAGFYGQRGFDDGHTWSIRYEHHWKFSHGCRLNYGIRRARRVYDGNAEFQNAVYGELGVLF